MKFKALNTNALVKNNPAVLEVLFVISLTLIAFIIRWQYIDLSNPMPINDGGLFYLMTEELIENNFHIPEFTHYNFNEIPYAYPALSFYLAAISKVYFNIEILTFEKFFPIFMNIISISCFFYFAKEILNSQNKTVLATLIFSISRPAYEWLIMGGGITRSPAYTFSILSLLLFFRGIKNKKFNYFFLSGIALGITASFHLEKAFFSVIGILLIIIFYSRDFHFFYGLVISGITSFLLFMPFFIPVFNIHGLSPYLNAFSAGEYEYTLTFQQIVLFEFFGVSPLLDIAGVLTLLGFWKQIIKKDFFLPIWLLVICLLEPRSSDKFAIIPAAILFSVGFEIIVNGISKSKITENQKYNPKDHNLNNQQSVIFHTIIIGAIILFSFISPLLFSPLNYSISEIEMNSLTWIKENTTPDASFLIIPSDFWATDTLGEWFPVITQRKSVLTAQGLEWKGNFLDSIEIHQDFINKIKKYGIEYGLEQLPYQFNHIYCSENNYNLVIEKCPEALPGFEIIYENGSVLIYQKLE